MVIRPTLHSGTSVVDGASYVALVQSPRLVEHDVDGRREGACRDARVHRNLQLATLPLAFSRRAE
jgi:hypothetical protein